MKKGEKRRFTLRDAILFVAATACGLGGWVYWVDHNVEIRETAQRVPTDFLEWLHLFSLLTVAWAWAVLISCWLPPRRTGRHLASQPGFIACLAAVVVPFGLLITKIMAFLIVCLFLPDPRAYWAGYHIDYVFRNSIMPSGIAPAVWVAWIVLALGRRWKWRAEPVEWVGITLGVYWIISHGLLDIYYLWRE